jgi:hypothetical protein
MAYSDVQYFTGDISSNIQVILTAEIQFQPYLTTVVRKPLYIATPSLYLVLSVCVSFLCDHICRLSVLTVVVFWLFCIAQMCRNMLEEQ